MVTNSHAPATWGRDLERWYDDAVAAIRQKLRADFNPADRGCAFDTLRIEISFKRSRTAGTCWARARRIWLHGAMTREHALDTFRHELAHLFAAHFENKDGSLGQFHHGPVFKKWARAMGDDGGRCHNYPEVLETRRGTWAHCPRCGMEFKKCFRGSPSRYSCPRCRVALTSGKREPRHTFTKVLAAKVAENPDPRIEGLLLSLTALKEAGAGSSLEAKRLRRQLRALGHRGGAR